MRTVPTSREKVLRLAWESPSYATASRTLQQFPQRPSVPPKHASLKQALFLLPFPFRNRLPGAIKIPPPLLLIPLDPPPTTTTTTKRRSHFHKDRDGALLLGAWRRSLPLSLRLIYDFDWLGHRERRRRPTRKRKESLKASIPFLPP